MHPPEKGTEEHGIEGFPLETPILLMPILLILQSAVSCGSSIQHRIPLLCLSIL